MAIIEFHGGPVTHKYLMGKTKWELASMYMDLLREWEKARAQLAAQEDHK